MVFSFEDLSIDLWKFNEPSTLLSATMSSDAVSHSDILIIGAGIFGTSTAYHLAKSASEPLSVTIIDQTPFPPKHAASTDINKIIRADYSRLTVS